MINLKPNFLERTILKKSFAKKLYNDYLLPKIKTNIEHQHKITGKLKNILHINTAAGRGGAAKVAHEFLNRGLIERGYSSKILVNTNYCDSDKNVILLPQKNPKLHKTLHKASKSLGWLDFFNPASFEIPNLKEFQEADIIHLHNLHGSYFSPFVLPEPTVLKPTIWTLHDEQAFTGHCSYAFDCLKWQIGCGNCNRLDYYPKLKKDTTKFLLETKKEIYEKSDFKIVCPSNWLANRVKQSILKNKDIRVIYNGINPEVFKPIDKILARKTLNLPENKKILLFSASGSFNNPQKGGEYLLKVYEKLKDNDDLLFVNIGGNSKNKKKNWLDVPYVNNENDMALYYNAADIFIYPSIVESFGLVVAEALSCETPVIAFNTSALPEIIEHEKTGYLANFKDVNDFIKGINLFLNDENLRSNAGKEGRKAVLQKFTVEKMLDNYINLYTEALI